MTLIHELRQELWLETPKGKATALLVHDSGQEAPLYFTVIVRDSGEIWCFPQSQIRVCDNVTLGRMTKQERI